MVCDSIPDHGLDPGVKTWVVDCNKVAGPALVLLSSGNPGQEVLEIHPGPADPAAALVGFFCVGSPALQGLSREFL